MSSIPPFLEAALADPSIRRSRGGAVMLTVNQLVLLQALRDFPDGVAPSADAWVRRARLYRDRTGGCSEYTLSKSARRVSDVLVSRARRGTRHPAALSPLGAAVLDHVVPAWIVGRGTYLGFSELVSRRRR